MKIVVLGGFLGSGKTTVLIQLAKYLIKNGNNTGTQVVILENEISKEGVDNQLLSKMEFKVENIFAGCICCSSSGQLCAAVETIKKQYDPQWLLIEATGMACPDSICTTLKKELNVSAVILTVVDAKRWKRIVRAMESFVVSQLTKASVVLCTKIDFISEEHLNNVLREIKKYVNHADCYPLCALDEQTDEFWRSVIGKLLEVL